MLLHSCNCPLNSGYTIVNYISSNAQIFLQYLGQGNVRNQTFFLLIKSSSSNFQFFMNAKVKLEIRSLQKCHEGFFELCDFEKFPDSSQQISSQMPFRKWYRKLLLLWELIRIESLHFGGRDLPFLLFFFFLYCCCRSSHSHLFLARCEHLQRQYMSQRCQIWHFHLTWHMGDPNSWTTECLQA